MTMPLVLLNRRRRGGGFNPATLFGLNEPGVWYDPSDLTTMFTDTAGTTPATVGTGVALLLDKSKGLVLGSELVTSTAPSVANWTNTSTGVTVSDGQAVWAAAGSGARVDPASSVVAGRTYEVLLTVSAISSGSIRLTDSNAGASGPDYSSAGTFRFLFAPTTNVLRVRCVGTTSATVTFLSVRELPGFHATQSTPASRPTLARIPASGRRNILVGTATLATQTRVVTAAQHTLSFRGTGTVTLTGASTSGPLVGTGANDIVSLTFTPTAGNLTLTVSGTVNDAQLELGAVRTAYQLVGATTFDVTEAGQPDLWHLSFDGIDDWLVTPTITPGVDKVQVFAGVRKLSDAAQGVLAETSTDANLNSGTLVAFAPFGAADSYGFRTRGTTNSTANNTGFTSPITNVVTGIGDISGDTATLRVNGTQAAQSTADQGTGNYLAYPIYVGRRAGISQPFNGHIYSLITRFGPNLTSDTIGQTERYVGGKTGIFTSTQVTWNSNTDTYTQTDFTLGAN
jgi:hypothetical protein